MNLSEPQAGAGFFWSKGFRPFFLVAAAFACVSMAVWMAALFFGLALDTGSVSYFQWHAHELLFGYASAVISGFLLTAVTNWTGRDTLSGYGLMVLVAAWLVARVGWLVGGYGVWVGGVTDGLFWLLLIVAVARPVIATKQWRQLGVLAKLLLMFSAHVFFFLDAIGLAEGAAYPAIYIG
ncbi:MAG: NnrS family protein, partial [Oceanospirillaceae bacterium]|nr:NnrS family protein [Oceanospirillaceae bacterium]